MKEIWKDVKGYEGKYQVSNLGNIRSLHKYEKEDNIRKLSIDKKGYKRINLFKDGKGKTHKVHRLVAEAFIPNPHNKPTVDHIDGDKSNNRVDNLRWFDYKEQVNDNEITRNRMVNRTYKRSRPIRCITTGKEFKSITEAQKYYNIRRGSDMTKFKSYGKLPDGTPLTWEYINKDDTEVND